jgi:hypothetical protein
MNRLHTGFIYFSASPMKLPGAIGQMTATHRMPSDFVTVLLA